MKISQTTLLRVVFSLVMLALTVLYVRTVDWADMAQIAADASVAWLVVSALGNVPLIALKALRLRLLVGRPVPVGRLMGMYVASYAADNLVMSQAGLGVRVAILIREEMTLGTAISSQVVEKVCEGVGLAIIALPLLGADLPPALHTMLVYCLAIGAACAIVLAVLAALKSSLRIVKKLVEITSVLRDPRVAVRVLALTLAAWVVEIGIVYAALFALGLPMPFELPLLVLLAVNVAALVPGLPGNMGSFEMACVLALGAFDIDSHPAFAFALIYHALHTIPVTLVGLPGFLAATRKQPVDQPGPPGV